MLKGRKILITGGVGSLGKALTKGLYKNNNVVIYSRNEERQYLMNNEFNSENIEYVIGDIRDTDTLKIALRGCDMLIHAAAMKDMIMCEKQTAQTYLNNIEGSMSVIKAVEESEVKKAIGVSTDKAASPTNVYGMTKYIMEKLFIEAGRKSKKIYCCTRFGNMINSTGSLITIWRDNPETHTSIKLTHPKMERFFFTVEDAAGFVINTLKSAKNGEIYIPKMKKATVLNILKIITKRENFEIIGLFPGEKIYEELIGEAERYFSYDLRNCYVIRPDTINSNPPQAFSTKNASLFSEKELKNLIYT